MSKHAVPELPVALFVYNRPGLLERTLACLRETGIRTLVVFSDGPRTDVDAPLVEAARRRIRAIDWTTPTLVEREHNLGLSESIRSGLAWMLERFDRTAVVEDDVVVAPEFGSFVAQALAAYEDDDRVAGVTGLRMPFSRAPLRSYAYDALMLPRFFSLGWATWRRAWETFDFDSARLLARLQETRARPEIAGADLPRMIRSALVHGRLGGSWDVYVATSMVVAEQLFLVPTWNMVENTGLASGTHPMTPKWRLRWETELRPAREAYRFPPAEVDPRILKSWRVFMENPQGWTPRRLVPRPARMLVRRLRGTYDVFRDTER